MDVKSISCESSVGSEKHSRENTFYHREYLYQNKHNVGRNISVKDVSGDPVPYTCVENRIC